MTSITFVEWRILSTTFGPLYFKAYKYNGTFGGSSFMIDGGDYYSNPDHYPNFYGAKVDSDNWDALCPWSTTGDTMSIERSGQNVIQIKFNNPYFVGSSYVQYSRKAGVILSNIVVDNNGKCIPMPGAPWGSGADYDNVTISDYTQFASYEEPVNEGSFGYIDATGKPISQFQVWADTTRTEYKAGASLFAYSYSTSGEPDPYAGGGDSGPGGGGGTFNDTGDDIPVPSLPSLSAADAGFITLFNPSVSQLNALARYMWTNSVFDIANFKKLFEDPMDCILGLSIVPISVTTSGNADVAIGNMLISSIQFPVVSSQYQEFDCGSIPLTNAFFGGYLDFEPYTKIQIVVPYCGTFQISADDVMGKTINLVYHIDVLTGSCVAMLKCGSSILYQFNGSCAVNIPVNNISYQSTIENATRIAVAIGTTVAVAGAAAPASAAASAPLGAATAESAAKSTAIGAAMAGAAPGLAGATAEGALSMKPSIERSGALSSSSGMMSVQTPYIVITRPRLCIPANQNKIKGYPSFITVKLSALEGRGYTEFDTVILENLFLTDEEKGELITLLRSGVYL